MTILFSLSKVQRFRWCYLFILSWFIVTSKIHQIFFVITCLLIVNFMHFVKSNFSILWTFSNFHSLRLIVINCWRNTSKLKNEKKFRLSSCRRCTTFENLQKIRTFFKKRIWMNDRRTAYRLCNCEKSFSCESWHWWWYHHVFCWSFRSRRCAS